MSIQPVASDLPADAPEHLSDASAIFWSKIAEAFVLEPHECVLLRLTCEAMDRAEAAREVLAEKGPVYLDRFECPHPRPEVAIERDSRLAVARLLKQLGIAAEPPWGCRRFRQPADEAGAAPPV